MVDCHKQILIVFFANCIPNRDPWPTPALGRCCVFFAKWRVAGIWEDVRYSKTERLAPATVEWGVHQPLSQHARHLPRLGKATLWLERLAGRIDRLRKASSYWDTCLALRIDAWSKYTFRTLRRRIISSWERLLEVASKDLLLLSLKFLDVTGKSSLMSAGQVFRPMPASFLVVIMADCK